MARGVMFRLRFTFPNMKHLFFVGYPGVGHPLRIRERRVFCGCNSLDFVASSTLPEQSWMSPEITHLVLYERDLYYLDVSLSLVRSTVIMDTHLKGRCIQIIQVFHPLKPFPQSPKGSG